MPPKFVETVSAPMPEDDELSILFERYSPIVERRAWAILGNAEDAKDVTQDVFIKAFLESRSFSGLSQISTWLYRITTNECLNRLRNENRRRALRAVHMPLDTHAQTLDPAGAIAVRRLLAEIDENEAKAAIYVYVDGMSYREAAELLGCAKRTVGNLLERFQRAAGAQLGENRPRNQEMKRDDT